MRQASDQRRLNGDNDDLGYGFILGALLVVILLALAWWYAFGASGAAGQSDPHGAQSPAGPTSLLALPLAIADPVVDVS